MEESTSDMSVRDLGKRLRVEDEDTKETRRMRVSSSDFRSEESEMSGVTSEHIFADGSSGSIFEPINIDFDDDYGMNYEDTELDALDPDLETKYDSWETLEHMLCSQNISVDDKILLRCLNFCYLFPKTYEFHKDDMIQLWMALAFFPFRLGMEDAIGVYFEEFEMRHVFLPSSFDASTGRLRYKLNHSVVDLLHQRHHNEDAKIGEANSHISENTLHSSLPYRSMHSVTLKNLYQAKRLSSLLIIHEPGYVHQIPRELFLKLPFLRALDFSYTNITELPNSIGKLKGLRYLNLSGTPITTLPSSLCSLYQMQTLKLRSCSKLACLPDDIRNLKDLRHLELDLACILVSMPLGLGDLTELQSLTAFIVGKENGCRITELKHMLNLCGTLRILRLENVSSSEEAKGAILDGKIHLQKLELQWTGLHDGIEVLENLKPHTELRELQIVGYGGLRFPSWMGDSLFSKLATITIHDSKSCEVLPPLGKLPFLCDLFISEMHGVKVIDHQFCGRKMDAYFLELGRLELGKVSDNLSNANMFQAFPRLKKLTLNGFPSLERWTGVEEGDFPHLQNLNLSSCSKLTAFAELSVLKDLHELVISSCPSLGSFPNEGLPTLLQNLVILNCPLLKQCCQRDWRLLRNIPNLWINYQRFSPLKDMVERLPVGVVRNNKPTFYSSFTSSPASSDLSSAAIDRLLSPITSHELDSNGASNNLLSNAGSTPTTCNTKPTHPEPIRNGSKTTAEVVEAHQESEWVEQHEPGVYITLTALPGGVKDLKRVRFSRTRFNQKQAEQWWAENRARVYELYNVRVADKPGLPIDK